MNAHPCPRLESADLTALLFNDLPAAELQELETHLELCPECRARVAELRVVLEAMPVHEEPVFRCDVQRLQARVAGRIARRTPWLPALATGFCALAALVFFTTGPTPPLAPQSDPKPVIGEMELLQNLDLLQSLDLLENLDLLEELEKRG